MANVVQWWFIRRADTRDDGLCDNKKFSQAFDFGCVPMSVSGNYLAVDIYRRVAEDEEEDEQDEQLGTRGAFIRSCYLHSGQCDQGITCQHRAFTTSKILVEVMVWVQQHFTNAQHSLWRILAAYFSSYMRTCWRKKRQILPWTPRLADHLGYTPDKVMPRQARNWKQRFTCTEPALMFMLRNEETALHLRAGTFKI